VVDQAQEDLSEGVSRRRFSLEPDKINYSVSERELFRLLPKNGSKISSTKLTELKMKMLGDWDVEHPQKNVTIAMTSLRKKVEVNREAFRICRTKRCGPHPIQYWVEWKK